MTLTEECIFHIELGRYIVDSYDFDEFSFVWHKVNPMFPYWDQAHLIFF